MRGADFASRLLPFGDLAGGLVGVDEVEFGVGEGKSGGVVADDDADVGETVLMA